MRVLLQTIAIITVVASTVLAGCLIGPRPFQTQSGLRISILRQGKGPKVAPGAEVEIHEITSLMTGEAVFSSYTQGYPLRFCQGAGMVIKGVDGAVLGMKAGEIRSVIVPPHLSRRGYRSKNFAPEDTLLYRLELVRIVGSSCSQPCKLPSPFLTQSGLQIRTLYQGKGPKVVPGADVEIHEIIGVVNGEVLFNTYKRGYPLRFCQGAGIVTEWVDEAVLGMKAGERRYVIVPSHRSRHGYRSEEFRPEDRLYYNIELVRIVGGLCNQPSKPDNEGKY